MIVQYLISYFFLGKEEEEATAPISLALFAVMRDHPGGSSDSCIEYWSKKQESYVQGMYPGIRTNWKQW